MSRKYTHKQLEVDAIQFVRYADGTDNRFQLLAFVGERGYHGQFDTFGTMHFGKSEFKTIHSLELGYWLTYSPSSEMEVHDDVSFHNNYEERF